MHTIWWLDNTSQLESSSSQAYNDGVALPQVIL